MYAIKEAGLRVQQELIAALQPRLSRLMETYDPTKGARFSTYVVPPLKDEAHVQIRKWQRKNVSLDQGRGEGKAVLRDSLSEQGMVLEEQDWREDLKEGIDLVKVMEILEKAGESERNRKIFQLRAEGWELIKIGLEVGLGRKRISQLMNRMKKKLRQLLGPQDPDRQGGWVGPWALATAGIVFLVIFWVVVGIGQFGEAGRGLEFLLRISSFDFASRRTQGLPVSALGMLVIVAVMVFLLMPFYREISRTRERNLRSTLKFLSTLRPRRPLTVPWGGRSRQMTSTFLRVTSQIWNIGIVTRATYSIPLAVMISTLRRDLVGSQPMLSAASGGMLVRLAPVSRAKARTTGLPLLPFKRTSTGMKFNSGSRKYSGMSQESDGVTFREFILGISHVDLVFVIIFGNSLVDSIAIGTVFQKGSFDGPGMFHFIDANQQPFVFESFLNGLNLFGFRFHWMLLPVGLNIPFEALLGNNSISPIEKGVKGNGDSVLFENTPACCQAEVTVKGGKGSTDSPTPEERQRAFEAYQARLSPEQIKVVTVRGVKRALMDFRGAFTVMPEVMREFAPEIREAEFGTQLALYKLKGKASRANPQYKEDYFVPLPEERRFHYQKQPSLITDDGEIITNLYHVEYLTELPEGIIEDDLEPMTVDQISPSAVVGARGRQTAFRSEKKHQPRTG